MKKCKLINWFLIDGKVGFKLVKKWENTTA